MRKLSSGVTRVLLCTSSATAGEAAGLKEGTHMPQRMPLLVFVLLLFILAGCGGSAPVASGAPAPPDDDVVTGDEPAAEPSEPLDPAPSEPPVDVPSEPLDLPSEAAGGTGLPMTCQTDAVCYPYTQMQEALDAIIGYVEPFFVEMYAEPPKPSAYYYVASGVVSESDCGDVTSDDLLYCGEDESIYMGQDAMWKIYSGPGGDAGLGAALSHEYGHHLQLLSGVPLAGSERETIPRENQADCVSGAWVTWADSQGYFAEGDTTEILNTLIIIADAEGAGRTHGTSGERFEALMLGVEGGLFECNTFFTQHPLISP